ncbi:MAG TPA: hypothetical protein VGD26_09435 [Chitinophagaceae bacterium]
MLFKVQKGKDVFELNPQLKAIEEFEPLTPRQMEYVILAFDYKTPFRKLEWQERKKQAALEAGYKLEKGGKRLDINGRNTVEGKVAAIEKARKKYDTMQKDEDYESLLGLSKLIADIRELNNKPQKTVQELEKAVKFSLQLPALMKAKKELEEILDRREDEVTDVGTEEKPAEEEIVLGNLSLLAQLNEEEDDDDQ